MSDKRELIAAVVKQFPEASVKRISEILMSKHAEVFPTYETTRSTVRYYCKGMRNSDGNTATNPIPFSDGAGSKIYAMPKSTAKPWVPFSIQGPCKVGILSDIHFPKHDERALANAVTHIKSHGKIDWLILNGDIADAEEFGSWAKSPKAIKTEDSVQCVRDGLLWLVDQFKGSRVVYKFGNHEERLDRYCWSRAPELVGMPHITWEGLLTVGSNLKPVKELECIEWVKDQRPIMLGKLPIMHGHELPKGLVNAVNPARGAFLRMIDTVLIGHHHRSSSHVEYNWKHEPINCWSSGCLCDLTPEYARINKWNHGHTVIDVAKNGSFSVSNYKHMDDGQVVMA
jgi:predicted phosphodiesterase